MFTFLQRVLPAVKIHSWGGFGSQLFTLHFVLRLSTRFPNRRVKVINHSSGVTRRLTELDWASFGIKFSEVDDFQLESQDTSEIRGNPLKSGLKVRIKNLFLKTLITLSILENANDETSFEKIKFWTLMTRGHYTGIYLDSACVESIHKTLLTSNVNENSNIEGLVIHYRLGDLLDISQKSPVAPGRVEHLLRDLGIPKETTILLSDSQLEDYSNFTRKTELLNALKPVKLTPVETLHTCISAKYFIGTGAKLSLWSAIFRQNIFGRQSFLPCELDWAKEIGLETIWF